MAFEVLYIDSCYVWLQQLSPSDRNRLLARVDLIAEHGPSLGRPVGVVVPAEHSDRRRSVRRMVD
jgi:hypothetical protein